MPAEDHPGGRVSHGRIQALDVEIDQAVRFLSYGLDFLTDGGIAEKGDRYLGELNVAAVGLGQLGNFLAIGAAQISEKCVRIWIDGPVGEIRAAGEVNQPRRRRG